MSVSPLVRVVGEPEASGVTGKNRREEISPKGGRGEHVVRGSGRIDGGCLTQDANSDGEGIERPELIKEREGDERDHGDCLERVMPSSTIALERACGPLIFARTYLCEIPVTAAGALEPKASPVNELSVSQVCVSLLP
ncbi:MAG: hypothetical protein FD180_2790 [Planctomycetota bacterium]|nr:MAG: hypothetical protein FD180_2790 [Planctomycetota bacterium]